MNEATPDGAMARCDFRVAFAGRSFCEARTFARPGVYPRGPMANLRLCNLVRVCSAFGGVASRGGNFNAEKTAKKKQPNSQKDSHGFLLRLWLFLWLFLLR